MLEIKPVDFKWRSPYRAGDPGRFTSTTGEFLFLDEHGHVGLRPPIGVAGRDEDTPAILATADPPDHTRHRALLSRILSTGAMRARRPSTASCSTTRWVRPSTPVGSNG